MERRHHRSHINLPRIPCIRPLPGGSRLGNPTGGPGSSPWQNGRSGASRAPSGPASIACLSADLFSDCFTSCSGTVSDITPGPVCGWTTSEDFLDTKGDIVFSPGAMTFQATLGPSDPGGADNPAVWKPMPGSVPSVFGVTAQVFFLEAATQADYVFLFLNEGNTEQLYIQYTAGAFPDNMLIEVGPSDNQTFYMGTVAPTGGSRKMVVVVDGVGVPTLFVDGAPVPLAPAGSSGGRPGFPGNAVFVQVQNSTDTPVAPVVSKLFLASGSQADATFCCPG